MTTKAEDKLQEDMKAAMRAGEEGKTALSVIRLARAALQNATIDKKRTLTEEEALEVLSREVKQRRETAAEFQRLGRPDAAARLEEEVAILQRYLPAELTADEVRAIVREAVTATGAVGPRDMGKVMGQVMPRVRGRADGKLVNDIVRELLAE